MATVPSKFPAGTSDWQVLGRQLCSRHRQQAWAGSPETLPGSWRGSKQDRKEEERMGQCEAGCGSPLIRGGGLRCPVTVSTPFPVGSSPCTNFQTPPRQGELRVEGKSWGVSIPPNGRLMVQDSRLLPGRGLRGTSGHTQAGPHTGHAAPLVFLGLHRFARASLLNNRFLPAQCPWPEPSFPRRPRPGSL